MVVAFLPFFHPILVIIKMLKNEAVGLGEGPGAAFLAWLLSPPPPSLMLHCRRRPSFPILD